jgi:hypothetical protein
MKFLTTSYPGIAPILVYHYYRFALEAQEIPYFHALIERLDATIESAVHASRVATYISPHSAFANHTLCSSDSFFIPLELSVQTLHPNLAGQFALADLLRRAAGAPPG